MIITIPIHLSAGTERERIITVEAMVSLYLGRYRIDKMQPLDGALIMDTELEDAYDQVIEKARTLGLIDPALNEDRVR